MSGKVDDLVMYIIMMCNDETAIATAERVTLIKGLQSTITFSLKVRGVNVIACTLKLRDSVAASNVPVMSALLALACL